jgi:hypothetical protein
VTRLVRHQVLGGSVLSVLLSWLLRGLMAVCGAVLVYQGLPVARAAWNGQKADAVVMKLRRGQDMSLPDVSAGIAALDRAVAADPVGDRYLRRSELEGGAALTMSLKANPEARKLWLNASKIDLELGLAAAPARSIDWLRLAVTRQALDGTSPEIIPFLLMSIQTGPWIEPMWPVRLRLIIDNWGYFTDAQKAEMQAYVAEMWKHSSDRRFFALVVNNQVDELIVRNLLRDQPGAQEELTKWILMYKK